MKWIFVALFVLASQANVFASCESDFNEGLSHYNSAKSQFEDASELFDEAIAEYNRGDSRNIREVCRLFNASADNFGDAAYLYRACNSAFQYATNSCDGDNSRTARDNARVCFNNAGVAASITSSG